MVSLSWRKRDDSNRMLLAPASSSKRSFFRKGKSSSKDLRSDQLAKGDKRSSREGWSAPRASARSPRTPPMTPEQDDLYCAPVSNVTVGKSPTNSGHKEIHLPKSKTKKAKEANRQMNPDDQTEYSDLTDNRTLKRLNEQKAAYEEALREAEKRKQAMAAAAANANNDNNSSRSGDPSAAHRTLGSQEPQRSFLGDILGMMDSACKPTDPPAIENVKSYTPEWGMAPSMDQTDARSPPRARGIDPSEQMTNIEEEEDEDDDDLFEDLEDQKEPSLESSARTTHENFEMVLEELNDGNVPKKRDWMKRFGRKKSDNQEEQPVDASRSHKDLVKQALFPELADGTTDVEELRNQEGNIEQARQAPPPPPAGQKKSKRRIFKSFRRLSSKKNVSTLDTVEEEPNLSTPPRANKAVPKQYEQHPVQKQVVDDIYRDLLDEDTRKVEESREGSYADQDYSRATYSQSDYSGQHTSDGSSNNNNQAGVLGGFMAMISETVGLTPDGNKMYDHPSNKGIPQSKSWRGPANHEDSTAESLQTPTDLKRSNSAPKNVQTKSFKRKKAIWKEVTDPKTGRSYYYHRQTRETTWVRPKEMDMPVEEETAQISARQGQSPGDDTHMRKVSERDFDRTVWHQKQEIARLLQSMAPPDGASVDDLLAQYEGREDELLARVRKMKESRPFDEPIAQENDDEEEAERGDVVAELSYHDNASELNHSMLSGNAFSRSRSGVTSKQSESTQQMANTSSRYGARKLDDTTAGGTSLSSHGVAAATSVHRVPSKIPVRVRSRELMVEELSSDRFKSEIYNNERPSNYNSMRTMSRPFMSTGYRAPPIVEENEHDAESSHGVTDSVSALSMNEMEFVGGKVGVDEARRRALDDAIRREDWDMAAAISEGMKALKQNNERSKPANDNQEWQQSELDKFISENDWEAVSEYIAELRSRSLERAIEESPMPVEEPIIEKPRDRAVDYSDDETPQDSSKGRDLRYGESYSSEDSSSYYSYSSSASSSAPRRRKSSTKASSAMRRRTRSRRREITRRKEREFAC